MLNDIQFETDFEAFWNSQAIKQKLQINRNRTLTSAGERTSPHEEDKAKILFGNRHAVISRSCVAISY